MHFSLIFVLFLYCIVYFFIPRELSTGVKNNNNGHENSINGINPYCVGGNLANQ